MGPKLRFCYFCVHVAALHIPRVPAPRTLTTIWNVVPFATFNGGQCIHFLFVYCLLLSVMNQKFRKKQPKRGVVSIGFKKNCFFKTHFMTHYRRDKQQKQGFDVKSDLKRTPAPQLSMARDKFQSDKTHLSDRQRLADVHREGLQMATPQIVVKTRPSLSPQVCSFCMNPLAL